MLARPRPRICRVGSGGRQNLRQDGDGRQGRVTGEPITLTLPAVCHASPKPGPPPGNAWDPRGPGGFGPLLCFDGKEAGVRQMPPLRRPEPPRHSRGSGHQGSRCRSRARLGRGPSGLWRCVPGRGCGPQLGRHLHEYQVERKLCGTHAVQWVAHGGRPHTAHPRGTRRCNGWRIVYNTRPRPTGDGSLLQGGTHPEAHGGAAGRPQVQDRRGQLPPSVDDEAFYVHPNCVQPVPACVDEQIRVVHHQIVREVLSPPSLPCGACPP